jgi:hypothetical protein
MRTNILLQSNFFLFFIFFTLILTSCKQSPLQLINKGAELQNKKKYKQAISKYNKALNQNSKLQMEPRCVSPRTETAKYTPEYKICKPSTYKISYPLILKIY